MEMEKRTAIVGAGAMGTLLGAMLASKGLGADLVDTDPIQVAALNRDGALVEGSVSLRAPVRALTPDRLRGTYDLVFLMVKQTATEAALRPLLGRLHGGSVVCTLQNGIPEPGVAALAGEARTLGCAVTWAATAAGPGVSFATSPVENWHSILGRPDGRITAEVQETGRVLSLMCRTELTENLTGVRWSKLLVNSAVSGVSAALGLSFGGLLRYPEALRCAQEVARECVRVARALGVRLEPLGPGENFDRDMDFSSEVERIHKSAVFHKMLGGPDNPGRASMLQDLERGRPTEVAAINGVVADRGREAGVPTPRCDRVVETIRRIEGGEAAPAPENLKMLLS